MSPTFRPITFNFPAFDTFSDEELNIGLGFLDGRWSNLIKGALAKTGATQLELNAPWASVPQFWSCPACGREKADLLRVTDKGVLVAKLETHHDHLAEYIKTEMDRRFGAGWSVRLSSEHHGHVCGSLYSLVRRFDDTLVCTDCNAADGSAKGRLSAIVDHDFSFRPSEIRLFIEARSGSMHSIKTDRAQEIWEAAAPDFALRKMLVARILDDVTQGALKKHERHGPGLPFDAGSMVMEQIADNAEDAAFIRASILHVELRSQSRPALASKKRRRTPPTPTPEILEMLAGLPDSRDWAAAEEEWKCPACQRAKAAIPRKAKRGKWIAHTCRHIEYVTVGDDPADPEDDFSVASRFIDRHRQILICRDCADVESRLKRDRPDLELHDSFLTIAQVASVITPAAHMAHAVDWERAADLATESKSWSAAVAEYRGLFDEAKRIWSYHVEIERDFGGDEESRFARLVRRMKRHYESWEEGELDSHLHWMLSRAKDWPGIGKPLELERFPAG